MNKRRFVVLDRDGTIIVERHYLSDPELVELIPGVAAGLRKLRGLGLGLAIVTNQSAIGRGYFDLARLEAIHQRMNDLLAAEQVKIDGIYVCPHTPDDHCQCRKPLPGMLEQASRELHFDPKECFVVGDKPCDVELGQQFGATTFLVRTGHGERFVAEGATADYVVADLSEAAQVIETILSRPATPLCQETAR